MRRKQFTERQILSILKQHESGVSVADLCREHGMSQSAFYKWRSKYAGMDSVFVKQVVRFLMLLIRHFSLTRYSPSMGLARPL